MFPWPDDQIRRPQFKKKENQLEQKKCELLNSWHKGRFIW